MFKITNCSNKIKYAVMLYIILIFLFIYFKPNISFTNKGSLKVFGTTNNENDTIFPLWMICILFAILSYYLVLLFYTIKK